MPSKMDHKPETDTTVSAPLPPELQPLADSLARIESGLAMVQEALSAPMQGTFNAPLNTPLNGLQRRERRCKIEADAELKAFVEARIHTTTFPELAAQIAANFPPDRRASKSSIHRWYHRQSRTTPNNRLLPAITVKSRET